MRRWQGTLAGAPARYFRDAKPAFLQLIDPRGLRVLDLGCGGGHNGAMLKKAGAREVVGVERDPGAAQEARKRLDRVVECDLAKLDPADLGDELFDAILASDVLEHLYDAEGVLARAVTRLRPGGAVVLSLPNVSNVYVFAQLLLQDVAAARLGHLRPHPRALVRQARHGAAAAGRRPARAPRRAVLHALPGDQDGVRSSFRCTSSATTGRGSSCCSPSSRTDLTAGGTVTGSDQRSRVN